MSQYTRYPVLSGGGGSGTVTSVGLSAPASILTVSGSPVTTSGTLTLSLAIQGANTVWAGPASGGPAAPTFRALQPEDLPTEIANSFAGYDSSGVLGTIPDWGFSATTGGASVLLTNIPADSSGYADIHYFGINFNPAGNITNASRSGLAIVTNFDTGNTGVDWTTNSAINTLAISHAHSGDGNVSRVQLQHLTSNLGNTTGGSIDNFIVINSGISTNANFLIGQYEGIVLNLSVAPSSEVTNAYFLSPQFNLQAGAAAMDNLWFASFNPQIDANVDNYQGVSIFGNGSGTVNFFYGLSIQPNVAINNFLGINVGGSGNGNITSYTGYNLGESGTKDITFYTGFNHNPNYVGNTTNFTGITLTENITGTLTNYTLLQVYAGSNSTITNTPKGVSVDMTNAFNGTNQPVVFEGNGGVLNVNYPITLPSSLTLINGHGLYSATSVPNGSPVTGTDFILKNLSNVGQFQDDVAIGPIGLGIVNVGFVGQMSVADTKTVDSFTWMLSGASVPAVGYTDGGTVTDMYLYSALGVLPGGGTISITNTYGFYAGSLLSSFATNTYGVYIADPAAENVFTGNVNITTAGKGLSVEGGSNAKIGTAVMVGGTVTVSTTAVTANSRIFISKNSDSTGHGSLWVDNITAGVSFDINSTNVLDDATVAWFIIEES